MERHRPLILEHGRVLAWGGRTCGSLAVDSQGRIAALGTRKTLLSAAEPPATILHLGGRLVLPGFTDSHIHLAALAQSRHQVDLSSAASLDAALRLVKQRAQRLPGGHWITGGRFDRSRWGERIPSRHDLDGVAPDHPVALSSRDGHSLWVNSLALRKCRITAKTLCPSGGSVVCDRRGQPTGILLERATALVYASPAFQQHEADEGDLAWALRFLLRKGITSVHAMDDVSVLTNLQKLREAGRLHQRIAIYPPFSALDDLKAAGIRSGFGDDWIRIGGLKLFVDGALGSQTAWLFEPYCGRADGYRGIPVMSGKELREAVRQAAEAGFACAIHAIGDRANAEALDAIEAAKDYRTRLPHRIEHAQLVRPHDRKRFRQTGAIASMQPCHILGDIEPAETHWGERSRHAYPIRSLMRAGVRLAFGSDAPVETADPMAGIYAAVCRQDRQRRPDGGWYRKEEGIGVVEALEAYSAGPAFATGEHQYKGRLRVGDLADLVVLSDDITKLEGRGLLGARVEMVVVGGRVRHVRRVATSGLDCAAR
ncbi:MAG: amidohydrolase [Armatimonadota bacterium]